MTLSRRTVLAPVVAMLAMAGPAWAGVLEASRTVGIDAVAGSTSFTIAAFNLPGQALTGLTVALSGGATASAAATNASTELSNFVTATFSTSYRLTGPGGLSEANTIVTSGASGAVARAGAAPGTLLLVGAGTTVPVMFTVPSALLSAFQGTGDVAFDLSSTGLGVSTSCVVLKPFNVRAGCGLPADGFGPATGIDTVTTKLSYIYETNPAYIPLSSPAVSMPAPMPAATPLAVPEPGSLTLLGAGMLGMSLLRRRPVS